jgi:hypothetical protein
MKMKTLKILTIILLSTLTLLSCKKDSTTTKPQIEKDSLSAEIHNLVPDSIINIEEFRNANQYRVYST